LIFAEQMTDEAAVERHYRGQWKTASAAHWTQQADGLQRLFTMYDQPRRILDFGSGSGGLTKELGRRGFDITPLEPMVHGYLKDQHYPHKFDVVVAIEVIEHLPNLWHELCEIDKVLIDNGIMVFSTVLTSSFVDLPINAEVFKTWRYKDDQTHVNFFGDRSIFVLAQIGGYKAYIHGKECFVLRKFGAH
jgi:2-polyprenyl-3-methyl-5-hydroxy-6-metoxy-1,4-benzoquinol methylase